MHFTDDGIVIKNVNIKESDKYLVILTANHGKCKVLAPGARSKTSRLLAAAQLFSYAGFTFFEGRGYYTLDSAEIKEQFFGLAEEITALSLASYFMELLDVVGDSDAPANDLLRLTLNALYALSRRMLPEDVIKPAFELRLTALSGFEPRLDGCAVCKGEAKDPCLNLQNGVLHCASCRGGVSGGLSLPVPFGALRAMRYILSADLKRVFSFSLNPNELGQLCKICEAYAAAQLDRDFPTLSYYHKLR